MMDAATVTALLEAHLEGCQIQVEGAGNRYEITVIGDVFEGKSRIQRHQLVYAALGDRMREEIHALSMRTLTPAEWQDNG